MRLRDSIVAKEETNPEGKGQWREMSLGECTVLNEFTYSLTEAWPFINYLDTGNISKNRISEIQRLEPEKDKIPSRARRKVQPGDIVYSTVRPNQRHFGMLNNIPENLLVSTGFAVLRATDNLADTGFIYWFLAQDHIVDYLHSIAENSTSAYPSIKPSDLQRLTVSLPPLKDQRNTARVLNTLDDKIELNRRMNETLEAMAHALFKSWFIDFAPVRAKMEGRDTGLPEHIADLFPDRMVDSELGKIPEGWEVGMIGNLASILGGTTPSTKDRQYWEHGSHCWATPKDLSDLRVPVLLDTERKITDLGLSKIGSGLLPKGTVLLSSRAPIGYLAITEIPAAINQGFIAMLPFEKVSNLFLLYWCDAYRDKIENHANGSTFLEISKGNFREISIVIPSMFVIEAFDTFVRPLFNNIVSSSRESQILYNLRDALLPKLISGELRVEMRAK